MSSIDPVTGSQRIEPQKPGPKPKKSARVKGDDEPITGDNQAEQFLPARSAPGGESSPNPIVNPDDPYNRRSGAGRGSRGTTMVGAGTTLEETSPKKLRGDVTVPGLPETGDLHPAGDTKTTTAQDTIDASDSVVAGQSHPVETDYFGALQDRHRRDIDVKRQTGDRNVTLNTATGSRPNLGETVTLSIDGVTREDRVWIRVKGPDQDSRLKAAVEGSKASGAVLITRPGTYIIGFEFNGEVVGETEFQV